MKPSVVLLGSIMLIGCYNPQNSFESALGAEPQRLGLKQATTESLICYSWGKDFAHARDGFLNECGIRYSSQKGHDCDRVDGLVLCASKEISSNLIQLARKNLQPESCVGLGLSLTEARHKFEAKCGERYGSKEEHDCDNFLNGILCSNSEVDVFLASISPTERQRLESSLLDLMAPCFAFGETVGEARNAFSKKCGVSYDSNSGHDCDLQGESYLCADRTIGQEVIVAALATVEPVFKTAEGICSAWGDSFSEARGAFETECNTKYNSDSGHDCDQIDNKILCAQVEITDEVILASQKVQSPTVPEIYEEEQLSCFAVGQTIRAARDTLEEQCGTAYDPERHDCDPIESGYLCAEGEVTQEMIYSLGSEGVSGTDISRIVASQEPIEKIVELRASPQQPAGLRFSKPVERVEIQAPTGVSYLLSIEKMRAGLQVVNQAHYYIVDKLSDNGIDGDGGIQGSLRHAVTSDQVYAPGFSEWHKKRLQGPRIILFKVTGRIDLDKDFTVTRNKTWIAGQSAPGPILVWGNGLHNFHIAASDVTVEHIDVFLGTPRSKAASNTSNLFYIKANKRSGSIRRVLLRNVGGALWADQSPTIKSLDPDLDLRDIAIVDSLFGYPIKNSTYAHESDHNYCSLITRNSRGVGLLGVMHVGCRVRHPLLGESSETLVSHIVNIDYSGGTSVNSNVGVGVLPNNDWYHVGDQISDRSVKATVVSNYFEPGHQTGGARVSPYPMRSGGTKVGEVWTWTRFNSTEPGTLALSGAYPNIGSHGELNDFTEGRFWTETNDNKFHILKSPYLWSEDLPPTHPSAVKDQAFKFVGSYPTRRLPLMSDMIEDAKQNSLNVPSNRKKLFFSNNPKNTKDVLTADRPGWLPSSNQPFTQAPNGKRIIENELAQRSEEVGAAPKGNLDRPLTTHMGGKLKVGKTGVVTWEVDARDVKRFGSGNVRAKIFYRDGTPSTELILEADD